MADFHRDPKQDDENETSSLHEKSGDPRPEPLRLSRSEDLFLAEDITTQQARDAICRAFGVKASEISACNCSLGDMWPIQMNQEDSSAEPAIAKPKIHVALQPLASDSDYKMLASFYISQEATELPEDTTTFAKAFALHSRRSLLSFRSVYDYYVCYRIDELGEIND